jgi:translation initiation factor IF-2
VSAAASIAAGLPRADGSRPNAPVSGKRPLPGLGLGVIAPPPGYDPNDPSGNRARAQRAAEEAKAERERARAPRQEAGQRVWRDERAPGAAGAAPGRGRGGPAARGPGRPAGGGRKGRKGRQRFDMYDGFGAAMRRRRGKKSAGPKKASPQAKAIKRRVEMDEVITVAQLAHGMSVKAGQVIKTLMGMGQMATANQPLDFETASLVAEEFEFEVINAAFQEDAHMIEVVQTDEDLEERPPVVTIMGHVDHGKTTLLDTIRKANVASGEAGGITQHVSAYQVTRNGETISFIDTPGHAAFTAMRARGAQVTDIVVLVVAADDGIMPQTVEVINHAKAADVEIIVALNKCDRPEANPAKVKQQLLEYELIPEEYGGDTLMVEVSALKGDGIDDLLDAILLVSEVAEYQANPTRHAEGTVIEARLERGRGPVATVLVQDGTLKRGDRIVVGEVWGRIRAMTDSNGKKLKEAGPSTPVEIMGLNDVPSAGDNMVVVKDDKAAKTLAEHRAEQARQKGFASHQKVTLEDLMARGAAGEILSLNLIIKADVNGSLEALQGSFAKVDVEGTEVKVLHAAVGAVSESDVTLAHTNNGIIIGFNVRPDAKARRSADEYGVQVRTYKVIYEAIEDVEKALKGLLGPTIEEVVQGTAEIRQTFGVPKVGTVAGCMVTEGSIARSHQIRLLRDGTIVWEGRLGSLRRFKDDVREVQNGYECGMNLDGFNDIKVGDILEAYTKEEVAAD